jgi:hypothetical protein
MIRLRILNLAVRWLQRHSGTHSQLLVSLQTISHVCVCLVTDIRIVTGAGLHTPGNPILVHTIYLLPATEMEFTLAIQWSG